MTHYSKNYVETKKLLKKLVVVAHDDRCRNLTKLKQMQVLLNEWDTEKQMKLRKKFLKEQA